MKKLQNLALAAALGFAVGAPLFAADTSWNTENNRSTAWSDAQVKSALDKCNNLPENAQAKCIVNIRPTPAGDTYAATSSGQSSYNLSSEADVVKDGNARAEQERIAAIEQCQSWYANDVDRCVIAVTERFGRT